MDIKTAIRLMQPHIDCAQSSEYFREAYYFVHDKHDRNGKAQFWMERHSGRVVWHNGYKECQESTQTPELTEAILLYSVYIIGPKYYAP